MSQAVQVNDVQGNELGFIRIGDTKQTALQRLSHYGPGGLVCKDKIGVSDDELISADGAPYVFKPQQQPGDKKRATLPLENDSVKRLKIIGGGFCGAPVVTDDATSQTIVQTLPPWNRSVRSDIQLLPMLVRDAYTKLSEIMYTDVQDRAVVTGMPGIGKSWFLDFFAWYCIQKGDAVILECDVDTVINGARRVELLVPKPVQGSEHVDEIESVWQKTTKDGMDLIEHFDTVQQLIGSRKCWNLIDYRHKGWKPLFGDKLEARRAQFVSPDRKRWDGFFVTEHDKGQEPIYVVPVWTMTELEDLRHVYERRESNAVTSAELECLVRLFGPSPRYCLTQFQLELEGVPKSADGGKGIEEEAEEEVALKLLAARNEAGNPGHNQGDGMGSKVCSSKEMLRVALLSLRAELHAPVSRAAAIIRGRIMTAGVVKELENIRQSPPGATCESNVSSRLLAWGVDHGEFMSSTNHQAYANYASPYIAAVVMEENSKEVLRSMSKFFATGDGNIGSGSGWMYENFILKYWLPILQTDTKFDLSYIGGTKTAELKIPEGYRCEPFGNLDAVDFTDGWMYLPIFRTLGAVDCFMVIGNRLLLFQVTTASDHSISKQKLEDLVAEAKKKNKSIDTVQFVFIVPHWRADGYSSKSQKLKADGKILHLTGPFEKDTKPTLQSAITALGGDTTKLQNLFNEGTSAATSALRKELQMKLASKLRNDKCFQDSRLEAWSVPRLLANLLSTDVPKEPMEQLLWPIQKSDYDTYWSSIV